MDESDVGSFDDDLEEGDDVEEDEAVSGNEVTAGFEVVDDMAGNRIEGGVARSVLDYVTRAIATEPDSVIIETDDSGRGLRFPATSPDHPPHVPGCDVAGWPRRSARSSEWPDHATAWIPSSIS